MIEVRVSRRAAERVEAGHPWVYGSDVLDRGKAGPGDTVRVMDQGSRPLGVGHYSSTSQITLRMLSRKVEPVDAAFFRRRIEAAAEYRKRAVLESDAYRVVFAEADLLPALIVDKYGDYLVIQTLNQGMDRAKEEIVAVLVDLFAPKGILERNDAVVRQKENLPLTAGVIYGAGPEALRLRMNGLDWSADLLHGQKTGVYLDQRENYMAAARYAHGRALDCFTSTGGFALHMAAGCEHVEGVDTSELALEIAAANRAMNGIENLDFRQADVFDLLAGYTTQRRQFDTIVLDPPAFAKTRKAVEGAVRGYKEINLRALRLLAPGGVLVTCSCSHHMTEADLLGMLAEASLDAGKALRVVERRAQSGDHPILLTVPETLYLKCLILQVIS